MSTTIITKATDSYLRLIRAPLDGVVGFLPGNGTGARPSAEITLDRADAAVRQIVGTLLRDSGLVEDAEQRRAAVRERERAARLRWEAERETERADARLQARQEQAEQDRRRAEEQAKAKREAAARAKARKLEQASGTEQKRKAASRKATQRVEATAQRHEPEARLETLEAKAEALAEKEKALTAADESRRLREAAGRAKTARKNGSS